MTDERQVNLQMVQHGKKMLSITRSGSITTKNSNLSGCREKRRRRRRWAVRVLAVGTAMAWVCNMLNIQVILNGVGESLGEGVKRLLQMCDENDDESPYITEEIAADLPNVARIPARRQVPSHLALCQELLSRHDQVQRGEEIQDRFALQEDEAVCMDWAAPHASLMEIFASTLIGHIGAQYGISYSHDCARTRSDMVDGSVNTDTSSMNLLTIQQIFPSSSLVLDDESVDLQQILQLCKGCTAQVNAARSAEQLQHMTHHCILYPGSAAPLVNENSEIDMVAVSEQRATSETYPIASMMTSIADRLRMSAMEWSTMMQNQAKLIKEQNDGVIIYVEDLSSSMKFELYAKHIPSSSQSISILANPLCANVSSCSKHISGLKNYLSQAFPKKEINARFLQENENSPYVASSAASYSRMILSKYLICPPGTVNCLLPALAKEDNTYAVINENQEKPNTWHWFDFVRSGDANIQVAYVSPSAGAVSSSTSVTLPEGGSGLSKFGTDGKDYREGCTELRGKLGSWEQDFHYNQLLTEDSNKLRGNTLKGVAKSRYQPVSGKGDMNDLQRAPDAPGWNEENKDCDLDLLNIDGLCEVMYSMKLSILQFVGDEYTEEMVKSFWKLLGLPDADDSGLQPYVSGQPVSPRRYRKTVHCQKQKYAFDIAFTTNDHLLHRPVEVPRSVPRPSPHAPRPAPARPTPAPTAPPINVNRNAPVGAVVPGGGYGPGYNAGCSCYPFQQQYQAAGTGRQFIVAGTGANTYNYDQYCNDIRQFQAGVRNYANPNDVVMYRTAVPQFGACGCQSCPGGRRHLEEGTRRMSEEEIDRANDFMIKSVDEYRRQTRQYELSNHYHPSGQVGPKEHILDVRKLTMTHPHAVKAEGKHGRHLCAAAGMSTAPQFDTWNHMLYSNMKDIAAQEAYQRAVGPQIQAMNIPPTNPYAYPGAFP